VSEASGRHQLLTELVGCRLPRHGRFIWLV